MRSVLFMRARRAGHAMFRGLCGGAMHPVGGNREVDHDSGRDVTTVPRTDL